MATREETLEIISTLKNKYPYFKPDNPSGVIGAYVEELKYLEKDTLEMAASIIVDESKFFPSVHEIKKIAAELNRPRKSFDIRFTDKLIEIKNAFLQTGKIDYIGLEWIQKWAGNAGYEHTVANITVQRRRMEEQMMLEGGA